MKEDKGFANCLCLNDSDYVSSEEYSRILAELEQTKKKYTDIRKEWEVMLRYLFILTFHSEKNKNEDIRNILQNCITDLGWSEKYDC